MPSRLKTELPKDYYLSYYEEILQFVFDRYHDLLEIEDLNIFNNFLTLSLDAKRLLLRLNMRKGEYFRRSNINYLEIMDLQAAINELENKGHLAINKIDLNALELMSKFKKNELLNIFAELELKKSTKKENLLQHILSLKTNEEILKKLYQFDDILRTLSNSFFKKAYLLYFGNARQDITEFILERMGQNKFENYALDANYLPFQSKAEISTLVLILELSDSIQEFIESKDTQSLEKLANNLIEISKKGFYSRKTFKLLNLIGRHYERMNDFEKAISLYETNTLHPSRERRIRILLKQDQTQKAIEILMDLLKQSYHFEETHVGQKIGRQLLKKWPDLTPFLEDPLTNISTQEITLSKVEDKSIENICVDWFQAKGEEAFYLENKFIAGAFGLFFWDIIFMPLKGAFFHPFQMGPMDLFSSSFYEDRKAVIDLRLEQIATGVFDAKKVISLYNLKKGIKNYLVDWGLFTEKILHLMLTHMPALDIASIFKCYATNLKLHHSGLPDLIVFFSTGGYGFFEVKGPGDSLRWNQEKWFQYFAKVKIPCTLLKVVWKQKS